MKKTVLHRYTLILIIYFSSVVSLGQNYIRAEIPQSTLKFNDNTDSAIAQSISFLNSSWAPTDLKMDSQLTDNTGFSSADLISGYSSAIAMSYQRQMAQSDRWQLNWGLGGSVSRMNRQASRSLTGINEVVSQDLNLYRVDTFLAFERLLRIRKIFFPFAQLGISPLWIQAKSSQFNRNGINETRYLAMAAAGIGMDIQNYSFLVGVRQTADLAGSSEMAALGMEFGLRYNWNN
jgi:hypothetical protein